MSKPPRADTIKLRIFLTTIATSVVAAVGAAQLTVLGSTSSSPQINAALAAVVVGILAGSVMAVVGWNVVRPLQANAQDLLLRMRAVLDHAEVGIALSRDGHFEMVSSRLCTMFGCEAADLIGKPTSCLHASDAAYQALSDRAHPSFMERGSFEGEVELMRRDGELFWARMLGRALMPGDRSKGTIWVIEDVTSQRRKREELTWAANHDGLTGLINRVAFERLLDGAVAIAGTAPFCALFIDLDRFKLVNDTAGHAAGDALLKGIAAAFRSSLRRADTVARLGGDEFGVILPGCPPAKARELAEQLRKAVDDYRLRWEGREFSVGASIGLVVADGSHANTGELINAADSACYEAKRGGRNRVSVARDKNDVAQAQGDPVAERGDAVSA